MPHPSPWPFYLTVALLAGFYAVLLNWWPVAVAALAATVACVMGWFWPRYETQET
jgi:hypothetical protein